MHGTNRADPGHVVIAIFTSHSRRPRPHGVVHLLVRGAIRRRTGLGPGSGLEIKQKPFKPVSVEEAAHSSEP
jgi:hypothetical protein